MPPLPRTPLMRKGRAVERRPIRSDTPAEVEHMPEYYEGMLADMWFRLLDIRRIVSDDTPAKIADQLCLDLAITASRSLSTMSRSCSSCCCVANPTLS